MQATSSVYNYRINGGVHHKISAFLPNDNKKETFLQFYVLGPLLQSTERNRMFPGIIKARKVTCREYYCYQLGVVSLLFFNK